MIADAEALEQRHRQRVKEFKRQKFIRAKKALYSKLKFYELKKVKRRLQQTRKELLQLMSQQEGGQDAAPAAADASDSESSDAPATEKSALSERIAEAQQRLRLHLDDLNYIRLYPENEPYVALFPTQDTEESQKKRQAMRLRIHQLVMDSRKGNEGNNDEEGGRDDMFVDAREAQEDAPAADEDPFEEAQALSDEEREQTQKKTHNRHGGNKPYSERTGGPRDSRRQGEAPAAARHKKGTQREGGGHKPLQNNRSNSNNWNKNQSSGRKPDKQHSELRDKRRNPTHPEPKQTQQKQQRDGSASAKDSKTQPTRIGLSKHKPANQHLIFDSDDE
ncbi:hypothetical protein, conserved [Eimeria brunetti]|uniref:rRNA-processing protein EFG1 n=1 Tax=Eimeria brunetti TaxID=51314 RepID=U6LK47_9EIME|nr:hypothetical protein, conserved [Eimeria brunetti]